jgi:Bax protein
VPAPADADRLTAAASPIVALRDPPDLDRGPVDRLESWPALPPIADGQIDDAPARSSDRLLAAAPGFALADAPHRIEVRVDRLAPSAARAVALVDETGWPAAARAWSSAPPRPELQPTARPSPAVLLAHWLPELSASATTAPLKTQFVQQLLPLVMQVNEGILQRRAHIAALAPRIEAGETLSESDTRFVADVLQDVRLEAWDTDEVLLRLDAVPLSMALAQAAQESGWGRSRSAREDNALFGQTMFLATGSRVQPFGDLLETVEAYARNLNSHRAYAEFRRSRAALRARGDVLDGHALVRFIERYSERGLSYVESIRQLMRMNNLFALDARGVDATLDAASSEPPAPTPASSAAVDSLLSDPAVPDVPVHGMDN